MLLILKGIWDFCWNTIKAFIEILKESPIARYITFGVLVAVIVAICLAGRGCQSGTDKRIEDRAPVIIEQQQGINAAEHLATNANNAAVNAGAIANQAQANVLKIQQDKQANVALEEANRNRCLAFPESEGCK